MANPIGKYRWTICALIFFATTINYLDRAVISLVKEYLDAEFGWSKSDYANITVAFQASYALGMIGAGRLIDKVGTKLGYALSLLTWSFAAMAHFLIRSNFGFFMARIGLGITESGNFPAAIKATSEWFPKKERAFATGIFNSGTNVGAIIAPLSVPFIAAAYGWRMTFLIVGAIGLVWLVFWHYFYDAPEKSARLSKEEYAYIQSDLDERIEEANDTATERVGWGILLKFRQTWAFALGKFMTDGIWWFYLFWLPDFLKEQYHLTKTEIALPTTLVYVLATVGSVFGGWLPMNFIKNGWAVFRARKTAMFIYACCVVPVVFAQLMGGYNMWYAIILIGFAAAAHQAWSANIFTTVSDMFPKKTVASVVGIGGMAGALGGILISKSAGWLFDYYKGLGSIQTGYYIMFFICSISYVAAWGVMHYLVPRMQKVNV